MPQPTPPTRHDDGNAAAKPATDRRDPPTGTHGCTYDEPWVGECGARAVQSDPPRCADHADKTCRVCGDPATGGCEATFGLVCGAPLCDDHGIGDCPTHPNR